MAVISGAGLVLMGLSTPTVSAATNAPANVIHSKNTVTIDGKTYNITQEQYINNDSDSNTGNETYNPAPVVQDTRPVSDFFDTDDNGNPIVSKAHQQELDAQKAAQQKVTDVANATQTAQQKATDEANAKATADQAKASAQQQAKDDLAAQQDLQQKQAQAEKLVAQQAAADKAAAEVKQQADIDEADAKAATQQQVTDEKDEPEQTIESAQDSSLDQATTDQTD